MRRRFYLSENICQLSAHIFLQFGGNAISITNERGITMTGLKQSELNWIREVVSAHLTTSCKLNDYANQVEDPQLQKMFAKSSTEAKTAAQNLINML